MAKSTKNTKFTTKAAKTPKDHLPDQDELLEIETSAGVVKVHPIRMAAEEVFNVDESDGRTETRRIIENNATKAAQKIIWSLNAFGEDSEFMEFMTIWQKASGIDLGESKASADS